MAKIIVLSDLHNGTSDLSERRGEWAPILLLRLVQRMNRFIKPDLVLVGGDLLDNPTAADACERLTELKDILAKLHAPYIAIPGNHDPAPELFYTVFPRPNPVTDMAGVRVLPFLDEDAPYFCATRSPEDLARTANARGDFAGPVITFQHVAVYPPDMGDYTYNHTNSIDIINAMQQGGVDIAIAGHLHTGFGPLRQGDMQFIACPALCEKPFPYLVLETTGREISVQRETLAMPPKLQLFDWHVHTPRAYCSENLNEEILADLGEAFGLGGLCFMEHSTHLYFNRARYIAGDWFSGGVDAAGPNENRMTEYISSLNNFCKERSSDSFFVEWGSEIDFGCEGHPIIHKQDWTQLPHRMAAVHHLSQTGKGATNPTQFREEFLKQCRAAVRSGASVLAHPLRVFSREGIPVPDGLDDEIVALLRQTDVAAEINFHTQTVDENFCHKCLDAGVRLAFGSDSHNLYEVGEFYPHLALMKRLGVEDYLHDILLTPCTTKKDK